MRVSAVLAITAQRARLLFKRKSFWAAGVWLMVTAFGIGFGGSTVFQVTSNAINGLGFLEERLESSNWVIVSSSSDAAERGQMLSAFLAKEDYGGPARNFKVTHVVFDDAEFEKIHRPSEPRGESAIVRLTVVDGNPYVRIHGDANDDVIKTLKNRAKVWAAMDQAGISGSPFSVENVKYRTVEVVAQPKYQKTKPAEKRLVWWAMALDAMTAALLSLLVTTFLQTTTLNKSALEIELTTFDPSENVVGSCLAAIVAGLCLLALAAAFVVVPLAATGQIPWQAVPGFAMSSFTALIMHVAVYQLIGLVGQLTQWTGLFVRIYQASCLPVATLVLFYPTLVGEEVYRSFLLYPISAPSAVLVKSIVGFDGNFFDGAGLIGSLVLAGVFLLLSIRIYRALIMVRHEPVKVRTILAALLFPRKF